MNFEQALEYGQVDVGDRAKSDVLMMRLVRAMLSRPGATNQLVASLMTAYSLEKPSAYENGFEYVLAHI